MRYTPFFIFKVILISGCFVGSTVLIFTGLRTENAAIPPHARTPSEREVSSLSWPSNTSLVDPKVEAEMRDRLRILRSACARNGLDQPGDDVIHKPNPWEFLISKENHLVWCNVFKSASSSWMFIFNQLAGYTPEELSKRSRTPPLQLARRRYHRFTLDELTEASQSSVTFLIARHPFERLISGYRDKILRAKKTSMYDQLRGKILQRYRHIPLKQYHAEKTKQVPSFKEFVEYILDEAEEGNPVDMHWVPVYKFCTPCQINFTTIIKFETLSRDTDYILNKTGIRDKVQTKAENVAKDGQSSSSFIAAYLAELPQDLYQRLCEFYRFDFEIFGYDLPPLHSNQSRSL